MSPAAPSPAMPSMRSARGLAGRRAGVTLVELLVTLTVISILASLSLSGLMVARTRAKAARTTSTIRKISEILLPYYEEYETRRPAISPALTTAVLATPNGRSNYTLLKQIAVRRLMALELPERIFDVGVGLTGTASPVWSGTVGGVTVTLDEIPPVARRYRSMIAADMSKAGSWDGGELLHLIVMRGPAADPDVISHFRQDEVGDPDGDGLYEFVDGWNRGINFKRWPIGFASPMQPIDGTSRNIEPVVSSNGHRLVPLVYSAGVDGEYQVNEMPTLVYGLPNAVYGPDAVVAGSYDPFAYDRSTDKSLVADPQRKGSSAVAPAVVLVPVIRPEPGPVTFVACEAGKTIPAAVDGFPSRPDARFQTVGSVTGKGARDNITNHDLTR